MVDASLEAKRKRRQVCLARRKRRKVKREGESEAELHREDARLGKLIVVSLLGHHAILLGNVETRCYYQQDEVLSRRRSS